MKVIYSQGQIYIQVTTCSQIKMDDKLKERKINMEEVMQEILDENFEEKFEEEI